MSTLRLRISPSLWNIRGCLGGFCISVLNNFSRSRWVCIRLRVDLRQRSPQGDIFQDGRSQVGDVVCGTLRGSTRLDGTT